MNDSLISLNPVVSPWIIFTLAAILTGLFIRLEWLRKGKRFTRIIALLLIALGMLGLSLRPSYERDTVENPFILLTSEYDTGIVDSLTAAYPYAHIYRTPDASGFSDAEILHSFQSLLTLSSCFVLGEGLPDYFLEDNPYFSYHYFPASRPNGITNLKWDPARVSRRNVINGEYNNQSRSTLLTLSSPGGAEDSVKLIEKGVNAFELEFNPKQSGTFSYAITLSDSTGKFKQVLPLEIFPVRKLNVLMLQRYPSAEIRYLKNFLAQNGHGVVLRNQVSKNRFQYEYVNHKSQSINQLTTALLDEFDLLCLYEDMLSTLSVAESQTLDKALKSGLGLIILMDKVPEKNKISPYLTIVPGKKTTDSVRMIFQSIGIQPIEVVGAQFPSAPSTQVVARAQDQRILSGYQFKGLGKVGFQLIRETFSLSLHGYADAYSELWTPLIERTARIELSPFKIVLKSSFPRYQNDPVNFDIVSTGEKPTVLADGIPVPLLEDPLIDDLWHGKAWLDQAGWHQFLVPQDSTHLNFFVSSENEWRSVKTSLQIRKNQSRNAPSINHPGRESKPISPWIFFILIVTGFTYLWLEPRL